jgi:hypothetical protein
MSPSKQPTPEDRSDAIRIVPGGLASGRDFDPILEELRALHIRNNTFPAEKLVELASDAIDESGPQRLSRLTSRTFGSDSFPSTTSQARTSTTRASTPSLLPP